MLYYTLLRYLSKLELKEANQTLSQPKGEKISRMSSQPGNSSLVLSPTPPPPARTERIDALQHTTPHPPTKTYMKTANKTSISVLYMRKLARSTLACERVPTSHKTDFKKHRHATTAGLSVIRGCWIPRPRNAVEEHWTAELYFFHALLWSTGG